MPTYAWGLLGATHISEMCQNMLFILPWIFSFLFSRLEIEKLDEYNSTANFPPARSVYYKHHVLDCSLQIAKIGKFRTLRNIDCGKAAENTIIRNEKQPDALSSRPITRNFAYFSSKKNVNHS